MAASSQKANIICVGEAYGESEAKFGKAFVGSSGTELLRMLNEAGIITLTAEDRDFMNRSYRENDPSFIDMVWEMHPEIYRTNVINQRPPRNKIAAFCGAQKEGIRGYPALVKGKHLSARFIPELERLADELTEHNPNIVLALGNTALWALSGQVGISKIRGTTFTSTHTATGFKCLATYHPADIQRSWSDRPVAIADLMKAKRESEFPEIRRTKREVYIEPTLEEIAAFVAEHVVGCEICAVDIETAGDRITCIGFAPGIDRAIVVPFFDSRKKNRSYWPDRKSEIVAWKIVRDVLEERSIKKVFHNGQYDITFLWKVYGIKTFGGDEDTMLLSHAIQPESLKALGFLGSIFANEMAWKVMRKKDSETLKNEDE